MAAHTTESEIVDFYRDKTIFITGGSGFIGRILIEHLFRKCEVQKIFVLVRAKKGVEPKDRKQTIFNVEVNRNLVLRIWTVEKTRLLFLGLIDWIFIKYIELDQNIWTLNF